MTDDEVEMFTKAALRAHQHGRAITVFSASKEQHGPAEYVGFAFTAELLKDSQKATMLAVPRREAVLLIADIEAALNGRAETVDEALFNILTKKGPSA